MARHASWKGFLRISLASIPVQAYTASAGADTSDISFHQLHEPCMNRIEYKKTCPVHGVVPNDEIVSGFEFKKDQYVVVEKEELSAIAKNLEKSLTIESFVSPETISSEYAAGQTYYLIPDGKAGQKPYSLVCKAMEESELHGIGEIVISRKQRLVRLRVSGRLIVADILYYEGEIRPASEFEGDVAKVAVDSKELNVAKSLIEQLHEPAFKATRFADDYTEKVRDLIQAKLKGKKIKEPEPEEPEVISFIDALKKSVKPVPSPKSKKVPMKSAARKTKTTSKRKRA